MNKNLKYKKLNRLFNKIDKKLAEENDLISELSTVNDLIHLKVDTSNCSKYSTKVQLVEKWSWVDLKYDFLDKCHDCLAKESLNDNIDPVFCFHDGYVINELEYEKFYLNLLSTINKIN